MGNKKAFFVIGPEGSGTYMLAEALVATGCTHHYDTESIGASRKPIVIRRSLPHAHKSPLLHHIIHQLQYRHSFEVEVLFILRDWNATFKSISARIEDQNAIIYDRIVKRSFLSIGLLMEWSKSFGFTYITYEAFVTSEGFRKWLFEERLGLPFPADYEVRNENLKYYE